MSLRKLDAALRKCNFSPSGFAAELDEAWQDWARGLESPTQRAVSGWLQLGELNALRVAIALFVTGHRVSKGQVEEFLPEATCLCDGQQRLRARWRLSPLQISIDGKEHTWFVPSDPRSVPGVPLPADHVLGLGGATNSLLAWTPREHFGTVLDLGCGSGAQALAATAHADSVTGVDILPRALGAAGVAAQLAGESVELLQSDMFSAVRGRRFDLIVSNPPFVITPQQAREGERFTYRDGGRDGDDLVAELVAALPEYLSEGGVAALICNWQITGQWRERWDSWLSHSPLDAWVCLREVASPAAYAKMWLRDEGLILGTAEYAARERLWLDDFDRRGITGVGFGYVLLHRGQGVPVRRFEDALGTDRAPGSEFASHLLTAFARERGGGLEDTALKEARLVVPHDVTEERFYTPGAQDPQVIMLHQGGGVGRQIRVDTALAGLAGACDGELAIGQIIGALSVLLDADKGELERELLPRVRDLYWQGFLRETADSPVRF